MSEHNKVYIFYNVKTDYLEVLRQKGSVVAHDVGDGMFELRTPRGKLVGHAIMDASARLKSIECLDPLVKFAAAIKMARLKRGLTQGEMAEYMGISLLPYQRLESGGNNPTLRTILKLKEVLPEISIDDIAS